MSYVEILRLQASMEGTGMALGIIQGLVSCPRLFHMRKGGAEDQTANRVINDAL